MSKPIVISDELYKRIKPQTNNEGGRSDKKISFDRIINNALDDQDRFYQLRDKNRERRLK
jgi:hypothetical protein